MTTILRSFRPWAVIGLIALSGPALAHDWVYTAKPGDNLWNLSEQFLKQGIAYTRALQTYNHIEDPFRIQPGAKIRIPLGWLEVQPASATVLNVQGEAELQPASGGAPVELETGHSLGIGDEIRTGAGGSVTVEFADGSRLLVQPQSILSMDALSSYRDTGMVDTRLRLQGGRVESEVTPSRGPGSRYEIITPAAVAAVRGTHFRTGAGNAGDDSTMSEVLEGGIGLAASGQSLGIPAGFGSVVRAGEPPAPPRPLLPAPDLSGLPALGERELLGFDWPGLEGAEGYRAQLFASSRFERLLLDKVVREPRVEWNAPPDGSYALRIRAIDGQGLEGFDSSREVEINARPVPPAPLGPADGAALHGDPPELWWSIPESAASFHLQVAREADFTAPIAEVMQLAGSRYRLDETPQPGRYAWRVATTDAAGETGPFGDPVGFRILAVPAPVAPDEPSVGEDQLRFSWARAADARQYQFQLARDPEFAELLADATVDDTGHVMPTPTPGVYYFRARGISEEGVEGAFSPVNRVEIPGPNYWPYLIFALPLLFLL